MSTIATNSAALERVCRSHRIVRLLLFGSHLQGTANPDSDLDLLVEFEPGHVPGFAFVTIERELSELFGRRVDLRMRDDLHPRFRDTVSATAEPIYGSRQ
jgi:predicted nucleotidyltransferase